MYTFIWEIEMSLSYFTRLLMGIAALGLLNAGSARSDEPSRLPVVGRTLTDALRNEEAQSDFFSVSTHVTDASVVSNFGGSKGCDCDGKGCYDCDQQLELPGNTCVLSFFGDFRLRHESQFKTGPLTSHNRHRQRLRFRFGANFEFSDQLMVGFRARTGNPDDPNSPHRTFDGAFNSVDFNLDRAFVQYDPYWLPGLSVIGGKASTQFVTNPVYSELVWDDDINPEGLALVYEPGDMLRFVTGAYIVEERHANPGVNEDTNLLTAQLTGRRELSNGAELVGSLGFYYYTELSPDATLLAENAPMGNGNLGNLTDGGVTRYLSDFEIWNAIVAYNTTVGCTPVVLSGEYMKNEGAVNDDDDGYAIGFKAGQTKESGDRQLFYQYQDIEQEAIFAGFSNDDFPYQTNFRGHVIGVNQKLGKATIVRIWALNSERILAPAAPVFADSSRWTLRADWNIKF
jgi:hypothetical protein